MAEEPHGERIARVETKLDTLQTGQTLLLSDVRELRDALNKAKGGWLALSLVGGAGGIAGAIASKLLPLKVLGL